MANYLNWQISNLEIKDSFIKKKNRSQSYGLILHNKDLSHVLMVQHRISYAFMDFIQGKYSSYEGAVLLIQYMTLLEQKLLLTKNFKLLWRHVWGANGFKTQFEKNQKKFDIFCIKTKNLNQILNESNHQELAWGFPKGKLQNRRENLIDCACREVLEETGIEYKNYTISDQIVSISYTHNGRPFGAVYYLAQLVFDDFRKRRTDKQEINDYAWVSLSSVIKKNMLPGILNLYEYIQLNAFK